MTRLRSTVFVAAVAGLAACGGGGGGAVAPAHQGAPVQAAIRLVVPSGSSSASAARRRALAVAFNTAGVSIAAYTSPRAQNPTAVAQASFDISSASTNCTATAAGGRTCALAFALPNPGTDDFVVTTYDTAPAGGTIPQTAKQLGIGSTAGVVLTSGSNTVAFTVNGVVAAATVQLSSPTFIAVLGATQAVNVQALDAAQNTIVTDAYSDAQGNPVTIALALAGASSAHFQIAPASISGPSPNGATLTYSPTGMTLADFTGGFSVSVTATPSNGGTTASSSTVLVPPGNTPFTTGFLGSVSVQFIALGPDKNVWFTDPDNPGYVGYVTEQGSVHEFATPTVNSDPTSIASGPDGALWFTESSLPNQIGRVTTAGVITEFPITTANSGAWDICAGPDGNLWFTEGNVSKIGRITTAGVVTEFTTPTAGSDPITIVSGPDGALWFTELAGHRIGRITTAGAITEFPLPSGGAPYGITVGPDNALWFGSTNLTSIGRITTAGVLTEIPLSPAITVSIVVTGPDGNLWGINNTKLVRISSSGSVVAFPYSTSTAAPYGLIVGPDGNLWWSQQGTGLGKITF